MLPGKLQSKSLSRHNITLEKRETEGDRGVQAESMWVTFLKTFGSPSVSNILWNQAPRYPRAIFHEMELNMSLITSTGCLDNHIQKSQTWRRLQLHHGSQYIVDAVSIAHALEKHNLFCSCSAYLHLFITRWTESSQSSILHSFICFVLVFVFSVFIHCHQLLTSSTFFPSIKSKPAYNSGFYLRGRNLTAAFHSTAPPTKTSATCHCCVRGTADRTGSSDRVYFSSVASRLFMPPSVTSVQADAWLTDKAARPPCCLGRWLPCF